MKEQQTEEKQPKVKNMLLRTYLTSLLCMVLCVAMFLGTSFAWFTSEVTNKTNEIYIGTLSVGLYKQQTDDQGAQTLVDLAKDEHKLFDKDLRWEPGFTALETIQVANEGDLAFKYVLSFTDGAVSVKDQATDMELEAVAMNFDVWVYDHYENNNVAPTYKTYADVSEANGWTKVGTLAEVLSGKAVLSGNMSTVRQDDKPDDATTPNGTEDGVKTVDTYTIALHMKEETSDIRVMGHKISLSVKLVAYQKVKEHDGFGNGTYDDITGAVNTEELKAALKDTEGNVLLADNVQIKDLADTLTMADTVVLDGNGKTVTYSGGANKSGSSTGVLTVTGGTIRDLAIVGGENGRALYATKLTANLNVSGCTLSGAYAFNINSAEKSDFILNFTDTTFKSWTSYANIMQHAYFTDCTFEAVVKPYGDSTMDGCVFTETGKLNVSGLVEGEIITLNNCTYQGVQIDKAVLTTAKDENDKLIITCDNALLEVKDGYLILAPTGNN